MYAVPKLLGYKVYEEVAQLEHGELSKTFRYVYNDERGDAFTERLRQEKDKHQLSSDLAGFKIQHV